MIRHDLPPSTTLPRQIGCRHGTIFAICPKHTRTLDIGRPYALFTFKITSHAATHC
jgi:hypothetical protein